jgi:hypothetical protein
MTRNKPKTVQKSVTERPRGSQTKNRHTHTNGQNHAQMVVLRDYELLISSWTKKSIKFWGTFMAVQSERQYFSQNKYTFPLNSFHKTVQGPNTFGESAW